MYICVSKQQTYVCMYVASLTPVDLMMMMNLMCYTISSTNVTHTCTVCILYFVHAVYMLACVCIYVYSQTIMLRTLWVNLYPHFSGFLNSVVCNGEAPLGTMK